MSLYKALLWLPSAHELEPENSLGTPQGMYTLGPAASWPPFPPPTTVHTTAPWALLLLPWGMLSLGQLSLRLFFALKALDPTSIYPTVITCHSQLHLSPHQTVSSIRPGLNLSCPALWSPFSAQNLAHSSARLILWNE